ncbi:class I SAM-dependent methyltransferase [Candidatus Dojkabacteria bacterium]|nr:class I SAM-dependent methyltransferase [Candidatus Dojkabacteria bacterium]
MQKGVIGYKDNLVFDIYSCGFCNTSFVDPLKSDENVYNLIYSNLDKVPGYDRYAEYKKNIKKSDDPLGYLSEREETYWAIYNVLNEIKDKSLKILEVGCGQGYLTYAISKKGFNIRGVDISENAIRLAKESFGDLYEVADVLKLSETSSKKYDVIIATELIEHLEHPDAFMNAFQKMLNPGGRLILTTPNKSLFGVNVIWDTDLPPVHLWWFSENSMKIMAQKYGFDVNFVDFREYNSGTIIDSPERIDVTRKPFFDKDENFIYSESVFKKDVKKFITSSAFLNDIYLRLYRLAILWQQLCNNFIKKQFILCSVFRKKGGK